MFGRIDAFLCNISGKLSLGFLIELNIHLLHAILFVPCGPISSEHISENSIYVNCPFASKNERRAIIVLRSFGEFDVTSLIRFLPLCFSYEFRRKWTDGRQRTSFHRRRAADSKNGVIRCASHWCFNVVHQNTHKLKHSSLCLHRRSRSAMFNECMHWPFWG